jgi:hypothetical protein
VYGVLFMASKRHHEEGGTRKLISSAGGWQQATRGNEMPVRPAKLDPVIAEIIEALARTIIRDEDKQRRLPGPDSCE